MKALKSKKNFYELILILLLGGTIGCAPSQRPYATAPTTLSKESPMAEPKKEPGPDVLQQPPEVKPPEFYKHKVRWAGETLSAIARWYTGSQANWEDIVKVNAGLDPKLVHIGDEILIPVEMLKTTDPMPKGFFSPRAPKADAPASPPAGPVATSGKTKALDSPKKNRSAKDTGDIELFDLQESDESKPKPAETDLFGPVD